VRNYTTGTISKTEKVNSEITYKKKFNKDKKYKKKLASHIGGLHTATGVSS